MITKPLISTTPTIEWIDGRVRMIDQSKLPLEEVYIETNDYQTVCDAIYRLSIRGAPAIGVAGAYACCLAANKIAAPSPAAFLAEFLPIIDTIAATRPTAVNLSWAVDQIRNKAMQFSGSVTDLKTELLDLAHEIRQDDLQRCHQLALRGSALIPDHANVMTICNTGGLATAGIGTALGVIQYAHAQGKEVTVYVCETRPLLQGARLNTWELKRTQTPFVLITDSMAARTMNSVKIDGIFVGADRIAANGDTANKIGTYSLAVLARYHQIPFYVAAPLSTLDYSLGSGAEIPVEKRSPREVTRIRDFQFTMEDIRVDTPAFDVTPAELIDRIIVESAIVAPPFQKNLEALRTI